MTEHTPGPWKISEENGQREIIGGESESGNPVLLATVNEYWDFSENDANAYLIAAAPDLLAAAKEAAEWVWHIPFEGSLDVTEKLRAAIALAEGQS